MAGLGDLVVNLSADTKRFDKGISKAQGGLKGFASSAVSMLNPVTAAFTAMAAGVVGVGAAVWGLQSRIGTLAGVADKAAQTGLSGKFLQQLEFAADQSGVSAETLTGAIKKMVVLTGKAAEGSKEAAKALASFGLSADDLKTLSPEQQFLKIAQKLGEIKNPAERAAAAVRIFGKSGIEMTTLFAGGLNDINKLMADAAEIGIGLDAESLARVAEADDALQKMYASVGALVDQVVVGLSPAFTEVAEKLTGLVGPTTKVFEKFNEMPDKLKFVGDVLEASFDVAFLSIQKNWAEMLNGMLDKFKSIPWSKLLNPFAGVRIADIRVNDQPEQLQAAQQRLGGLLNQLRPEAPVVGPQKPFEFVGPMQQPKGADAAKIRGLVGDIWNKVSPIADAAKLAAQGVMDRAGIRARSVVGTLENIFTGETVKQKKIEPRLAGAMDINSQDAYSTVVQAMLKTADPTVRAIRDQTKELVKKLKPKDAQPMVAMGAVKP